MKLETVEKITDAVIALLLTYAVVHFTLLGDTGWAIFNLIALSGWSWGAFRRMDQRQQLKG